MIIYHADSLDTNYQETSKTVSLSVEKSNKEWPDLTQEIVRELLNYNQDTGELFWKHRARHWFTSNRQWKIWHTRFADKPAFTANDSHGYLIGTIFYKMYSAHRVIFFWMTGVWPYQEIDHLNHVRHDNRWSNLSEKDHSGQMRNPSLNSNNTSGCVGVYKHSNGGWQMQISANGREYTRYFKTFTEAVAARKTAELKYGYHENHGMKAA